MNANEITQMLGNIARDLKYDRPIAIIACDDGGEAYIVSNIKPEELSDFLISAGKGNDGQEPHILPESSKA